MAVVAFTAIGAANTCFVSVAHAQDTHLTLSADLAYGLNEIADTATVEHGACLYGHVTADTVYLNSAFVPKVLQATPFSLNDENCPGVPLAYWHVHIPHEYTVMGDRSPGPDKNPEDYCYLSHPDMIFALGPTAPPLEFVGVGRRLFCWFSRAQIMGTTVNGQVPLILWPGNGQLVRLPERPKTT